MDQLIVHGGDDSLGRFVVSAVGVLDRDTIEQFDRECRAMRRRVDVFDLRFVTLIGAAGASALRRLADTRRCRVVAFVVVDRVFEVLGLAADFDIEAPSGPPPLNDTAFGVAVHDSTLRFIHLNDAMAAINGLAVGEHVGRRPGELFDLDPERNDVESLLLDALETGHERDVVVGGETAAATGSRSCRVRTGRYALDHVAVRVLIAIVEPISPTVHGPTHQIGFSVAC